jgi:peptidoglycan/xylan/chitin deacetylase (PgdA/CDA1 family)
MLVLKSKIKKLYKSIIKKYYTFFYGSCAVLLYHRITDLETDPQLLSVKPHHFDSHLELLSKKFKILTVEEFSYKLKNKIKFPKKSVLITFDDGYADNYLEAIPILEKYKAQALFYIATGTLNTQNEYWWDAIERIVLLSKNNPNIDTIEVEEFQFQINNLNELGKYNLYENLLKILKNWNSEKREEKINELAKIFNAAQPRSSHRALNFEELKKMNQSKSAVIGAHTHLHASLGSLPFDNQFNEINTSKNILEKLLNQKILYFSYPFGTVNDFNNDTLNIIRKLNFENVAANYPYIVHALSDKLQFPRFLVRDWNAAIFESNLNTFYN